MNDPLDDESENERDENSSKQPQLPVPDTENQGKSNNNSKTSALAKKSSSSEFDFDDSKKIIIPEQQTTTFGSNKVTGKSNIVEVSNPTETGKAPKQQSQKTASSGQTIAPQQPKLQKPEQPLSVQSGRITNKNSTLPHNVGQTISKTTTTSTIGSSEDDKEGVKQKPSPFDFDYSQRNQDSDSEFDGEDDEYLFGDDGDVDDILDGLGY